MFYKKFIGQKKTDKVNVGFLSEKKKPALTEKIAIWIRGNFFIPDARRFWIKPSVKYLLNWLAINPADIIISTGPPHSMHLIASGIKKKISIPWIADFRDPWTKIDFYSELHLSWFADKRHHKLEKLVVTESDCVVTVGNQMREEFESMGAKKSYTITNGFDTADLADEEIKTDSKFTIAHFGTVNKARNPQLLWQVISDLISQNSRFREDIRLVFVGRLDQSVNESIKNFNLESYTEKVNFLPHKDVILMQRKSQVLLLLINQTANAQGILTGKFFEYLAAKRPIAAIGPVKGDVADILGNSKAGDIVDFKDKDGLKSLIEKYYLKYQNNKLYVNSEGIKKYSRYELTRKLAVLMEELIEPGNNLKQ